MGHPREVLILVVYGFVKSTPTAKRSVNSTPSATKDAGPQREPTQLYTTQGAAKVWSVCKESVRRGLRTGLIKGVRFGGSWRIPQAEVDRIAVEGLPSFNAK